MKIIAYLPCYNEELNIKELIEEWHKHTEPLKTKGYELLIVGIDDCSTDTTKEQISKMVTKYENVFLVEHKTNKGLCGGLNTAIAHFIEHGQQTDYMVLMDGDNTHDPKYIFNMLGKMKNGTESVIASRYCKESKIVGVARHRELLSDLARVYYRCMLRVPKVQDYTCGYRVYAYDGIMRLENRFGKDPIKEQSFACMMELLYKLHLVGVKFDEVGFELRYDYKKGASKMQLFKTMSKSLVTAITLKKFKR